MLDRSIRSLGIAVFLICLLGSGTAFATVKCQCNNGSVGHALGSDYGDDDLDEACNDACDMSGGGRVWSVDTDQDYGDDVTIRRGDRPRPKPRPRNR